MVHRNVLRYGNVFRAEHQPRTYLYVYIVTWRLWYIILDIIRRDENYVLESFYLAHEILYTCDIK